MCIRDRDYRNNYNNENETNNENMMAAEQNSFNGKKPSSKNKKAAKLAKKIGAIALSAVLFGGVAGGTFQAVNHFAGSTTATATTTTAQQTTSNSSLLKACLLYTSTSHISKALQIRILHFLFCRAFPVSYTHLVRHFPAAVQTCRLSLICRCQATV